MDFLDSHVHIGDYDRVKKILSSSIYKDKYKLYSAIELDIIKNQNNYLATLKDFFAIPIIFKEISIKEENLFVKNFCQTLNNGVPVLLIDFNSNYEDNYNFAIFKEHFLLHSENDYEKRSYYYDFLNKNGGFLLLHCKDKIRIDYVSFLRKKYPNMNIIIAHLGRNVYENTNDILKILTTFKDDKLVYFDFSTINDINNILMALKIIDSTRILYGTDFPYNYSQVEEEKRKQQIEKILKPNSETLYNIGEKNFEKIKTLSRIRRI